jgi:hypothetical protein
MERNKGTGNVVDMEKYQALLDNLAVFLESVVPNIAAQRTNEVTGDLERTIALGGDVAAVLERLSQVNAQTREQLERDDLTPNQRRELESTLIAGQEAGRSNRRTAMERQTQNDVLRFRRQSRMAAMNELELEYQDRERLIGRSVQLEEWRAQRIKEINTEMLSTWISTSQTMANSMVEAFVAIATGADNLGEKLKGIAAGLLKTFGAQLVQEGVSRVVSNIGNEMVNRAHSDRTNKIRGSNGQQVDVLGTTVGNFRPGGAQSTSGMSAAQYTTMSNIVNGTHYSGGRAGGMVNNLNASSHLFSGNPGTGTKPDARKYGAGSVRWHKAGYWVYDSINRGKDGKVPSHRISALPDEVKSGRMTVEQWEAQVHSGSMVNDLKGALGQTSDIDSLNPEMQKRIIPFMAAAREAGVKVRVNEAQRSQERQNHLFRQGRSRPGPIVTWTLTSNHRAGNAVDLLVNGDRSGKDPGYKWLWANAGKFGLNTLGANDAGHVEMLQGDTPEKVETGPLSLWEKYGNAPGALRGDATATRFQQSRTQNRMQTASTSRYPVVGTAPARHRINPNARGPQMPLRTAAPSLAGTPTSNDELLEMFFGGSPQVMSFMNGAMPVTQEVKVNVEGLAGGNLAVNPRVREEVAIRPNANDPGSRYFSYILGGNASVNDPQGWRGENPGNAGLTGTRAATQQDPTARYFSYVLGGNASVNDPQGWRGDGLQNGNLGVNSRGTPTATAAVTRNRIQQEQALRQQAAALAATETVTAGTDENEVIPVLGVEASVARELQAQRLREQIKAQQQQQQQQQQQGGITAEGGLRAASGAISGAQGGGGLAGAAMGAAPALLAMTGVGAVGMIAAGVGLQLVGAFMDSQNDKKREEEQYRAHLRALRDARREQFVDVVVVLPDGIVDPQNPQWQELLSETLEEVNGNSMGRISYQNRSNR